MRDMASWVYKCDQCEKTFVEEVAEGETAADKAVCPYCGSTGADKVFEIPQAGGCGCGGSCC